MEPHQIIELYLMHGNFIKLREYVHCLDCRQFYDDPCEIVSILQVAIDRYSSIASLMLLEILVPCLKSEESWNIYQGYLTCALTILIKSTKDQTKAGALYSLLESYKRYGVFDCIPQYSYRDMYVAAKKNNLTYVLDWLIENRDL